MRLTGIEISNFGSYGPNQVLDLSNYNALVISGVNGAGKSTLVKAVRWCVWGHTEAGIDDVVRLGQSEARVTVEFRQGGETYRILRARSIATKTGTSRLEFERMVDDGWLSLTGATISETQDKIVATIGLDLSLAMATSFAAQDKWAAICEATPLERRAILGRLLGLDVWPERRTAVREMRRGLVSKVEAMTVNMTPLQSQVEQLEAARETLRLAEEAHAQAMAEAAAAEQGFQLFNDAHTQLECELAIIEQARTERDASRFKLVSLRPTQELHLGTLDRCKKTLQQLLDEAPSPVGPDVIAEADKVLALAHDQLAEITNKLGKANDDLSEFDRKARTVERQLQDAERAHTQAQTERRAKLTADLSKAQSNVRQMESELANAKRLADTLSTVPCRLEPMSKMCPLLATAREAQARIAKLEADLSVDKALVPALETALFDLAQEPVPEELSTLRQAVSNNNAALQVMREDIDKLKARDAEKRPIFDECLANTRKLGALQNQASTHMARVKQAQDAVHAAEALLADVTSRIEQAQHAVDELDAKAQPLRDIAAERRASAQSLQSAREIVFKANDKVSVSLTAVDRAKATIITIEDAARRLEIYQKDKAAFDREIADLGTLDVAYRDVPTLVIETLVPEIEGEANALLERVSSSGLSIALITQKASKGDADKVIETLDLRVRDHVGERPYEVYSGGERFRVTWAFRVALAHVLSARRGVALDTMTLDEGFGSLDAEGLAAFAAAMSETTNLFGLTLVITHVPELMEAFPARLQVSKGADGSVWEIVS